MKENGFQRPNLPLMSTETEEKDSSALTFTITVDAKYGTSTGVSAADIGESERNWLKELISLIFLLNRVLFKHMAVKR
ncbi:unnamed protein product [Trifolium pratense]|uniref:Uncharacterized protein n=1 Tax=Trifolium pratense TaxID=57577 RepID=A0ACB0JXT5_TRIPR|nr:unnamed protein product [Trifolium pratense]